MRLMFAPCLATLLALPAPAQAPLPTRDAAALQKSLDKLQVMGSVLYVAAHPDDENTAMLTTFSQGRNLRAAYLSMTRGGGGQNLVGPELGDALAVLRTQELCAARRVDGAEQFFTRAVDFGFSKTSAETLRIWNHDRVLADVVHTIRTFRPDVIITRFSPEDAETHGHHQASAQLALEAFRAAADPARFPEQHLEPWRAKRIFWNTYNAFTGKVPDPSEGLLAVDLGAFDPLLGKSYWELSAESRSQHRSQGFGEVARRGSRLDYLKRLDGEPAQGDPFEGLDLTWARFPGTATVQSLLAEARQAYRPAQPAAIAPLLHRALVALRALPPEVQAQPLVRAKAAELEEVLRSAAGIWVEAIADRQRTAPGENLTVNASVLVRGGLPVGLASLVLEAVGPSGGSALETRQSGQPLTDNTPRRETFTFAVPAGTPLSHPYWLGGPGAEAWAGRPEAPAPFRLRARFQRPEGEFEVVVPVQFRFRDPVLGERYQPLVVAPSALVNLIESVQVFADSTPHEVRLKVVASAGPVAGRVRVAVPTGWVVQPALLPFSLGGAGAEAELSFRLVPPTGAASGELRAEVDVGAGFGAARSLVRVDYPHIPLQTLLPEAKARLERFELAHDGRRIGYVMGAGDEIPQALRRIGYQVELLSDEALGREDLKRFDAIVVGIRAFNTRPALAALKERLHAYVAAGGTEVVLYTVNTGFPGINAGMVTEAIGPYPFKVSRTRVTDETAPVRFLDSRHPVFHWPNELSAKDFDGWVQERSLYHAEGWDAHYRSLLGMADPGEPENGGALIVAEHGKGHYVYTGIAFFRQLPDGVPGATRLFANILALGSHP